jgi:hypothetical protein
VCFSRTAVKYERSFAMGIKFQDRIKRLANKLTPRSIVNSDLDIQRIPLSLT